MHQPEETSPAAVGIGHVHLRVADLDRAVAFYRDVLGLVLNAYGPDLGLPGAVFLAAGDYHHHVGLDTWESEAGTLPPPGHTGLYHLAILYPGRRELARAVRRLFDQDYAIEGAEDHGGRSRCTSPIRTATESNSTTTDRGRSGSTKRADRSSRPNPSIRASCWRRQAPPLSPYFTQPRAGLTAFTIATDGTLGDKPQAPDHPEERPTGSCGGEE